MKTRILINIVFVSFVFFASGCKKTPAKTEDVDHANVRKRLPIEVVGMRDGETEKIKIKDLPKEKLSEIYFVHVSDPKIKGEIYSRSDWRRSNAPPLSIKDAQDAMNQVEVSLKRYYGDDSLAKIIEDREKLSHLSE